MKTTCTCCFLWLLAATLVGCGGANDEDGAPTPEDAVAQMRAALVAGDAEAMANVMAPPWSDFTRRMAEAPKQIVKAQQEIDAAMDAAFGPRAESASLPFGSTLADALLSDLKHEPFEKKEMQDATWRVVDRSETDGKLVLTVEETWQHEGQERQREHRVVAEQIDGAWKLSPYDVNPAEPKKHWDDFHKLLDAYATVTREIQDGHFQARWEVERYMTWVLARNADWLANSSHPPGGFHDDLSALGMLREELDPSAVPDDLLADIRIQGDAIYWMESITVVEAAELAARLKQLRSENPFARFRVTVTSKPQFASSLKAALGAILDSGDDVPRVAIVFEDPQLFQQVEPEFVGRLRLFTMHNPATRGPEELRLEEPDELMIDPSIEPDFGPEELRPVDPSSDAFSVPGPENPTGDLPSPEDSLGLPDENAPQEKQLAPPGEAPFSDP